MKKNPVRNPFLGKNSMRSKKSIGGTSPQNVKRAIQQATKKNTEKGRSHQS